MDAGFTSPSILPHSLTDESFLNVIHCMGAICTFLLPRNRKKESGAKVPYPELQSLTFCVKME